MLVLDTTSKTITAVLSAAPATNQPNYVVAWADNNGTTFTEGASDGTLNGTSTVTMVASPAASTRRVIKSIYIQNTDTAQVTVTVGYYNGTNTRVIAKVILNVGDTWTTDATFDPNGQLKYVFGSVNAATQLINQVPIANGGTGQSTANSALNAFLPNQASNNGKYLSTDGTNTSWATVGTVTSVSGTGTVSGISLSGTVTSSGNLTLGGALDLSSPPAIGGTTASTGRFTTIQSTVATGTAPFTVASTTPVTNLSIGGNAATATNVAYSGLTGTVPTWNQNTTGSAATLTTARGIYGNNFDGSASLTQIIASTYGGTGNGFTKFSGATTSEKTYTLPDATTTILTTNAAVTVGQGGTGQTTTQAAMNSFAGAVTSGSYLRGNGTNVVMSTIQAADVPTLNQNTSGTAAGLSSTLAIASGGTGSTTLAGASIATYAGIETLTNKRIDPRVTSAASASTLTPSIATADVYAYTALAANLAINAPTGTPVDGDKLIFRILDNGTARNLTWDATYTVIGVTLPTTTTANKTTYVGCIYNAYGASGTGRWDVIAVTTQA